MIKNICNYNFFIEKYSKKNITISPTQNNSGIIEVDDDGNKLSSAYFTLGDIEVGILTQYDHTDSLLVYDSMGYDLYNKNDNIDMMVEWGNGTRYLVGSRIERSTSFDTVTNKFLFGNLLKDEDSIFKAYINNYEIPRIDLALDNQSIQVVGGSRDKLNSFGENDMVVILYKTDQTITTDIKIEYMSVDSIIDIDAMSDLSYFDNTFSKKYNNIKSISDSLEVITTKVRRRRQSKARENTTSITNRLSLEMYEDTKYDTLSTTKVDDIFRIVAVGSMPSEIVIWNNCRLNPSNTSRYDKELNSMSYTIIYDNKQEILLDDSEKVFKYYNDGVYNDGIFG